MPNPRVIGSTTWRRLVIFYLLVGGVSAVVPLAAPLAPSGHDRMVAPWLAARLGYASGETVVLPRWLDAALAMVGACLLAIPLGFVYIRTRTRQKYDESLINTVIVLPPLVTAILVVVQNSLALAFTLAGIVAAVRFRSNLKDSRDAVYILAAVGIGFAAGVHVLDVAVVVSLGFAVLELVTWKANLARDHDRVMQILFPLTGETSPADPGAAPAGHGGRWKNDDAVARSIQTPATEDGPPDGPDRASHSHKAITLQVVVSDIDDGRAATEGVLERLAKTWEFRSTVSGGGATLVLEYRVRPRKRHPVDQLLATLRSEGTPVILRADVVQSRGAPVAGSTR